MAASIRGDGPPRGPGVQVAPSYSQVSPNQPQLYPPNMTTTPRLLSYTMLCSTRLFGETATFAADRLVPSHSSVASVMPARQVSHPQSSLVSPPKRTDRS